MGNLVQVLVDTSLTVTETFSVDGSPIDVDAGLPTLVATYPSGTALSPVPTVSSSWTGRTTGQYRFGFDAEPEVIWADYELTGTIGGKVQKLKGRVEWLGALLFNLAELRGLRVGDEYPFAADATPAYSTEQLQQARSAVLDEFEQRLGFSPVPRFAREELDGDGHTRLGLSKLKAHQILSVTVNGTAQATSGYRITKGNELQAVSSYGSGTAFPGGFGNVAVEYAHGTERVPGEGNVAAMAAVCRLLIPGFSSAARTVTTPDGVTYDLGDAAGQVTRGGTTRRFGIPFIDAYLAAWSQSGLAMA